MLAAALREFGGPEKFEIMELPKPVPTAGMVLIKTHAAGIHYADIRVRRGEYPFDRIPRPVVPGFEVAGTIEAVGEGVEGFRPGMRVMGGLVPAPQDFGKRSSGGYAEYSLATVAQISEIPQHVTFEQAVAYVATLPPAYALFHGFQTFPSDATVLVHTAGGGLGTGITLVAKEAGNKVIALVRREENVSTCLDNGADHVVISSREGWVDEVLALTGGRGVDVSFNSLGGNTIKNDVDLLALNGTLMHTAFMLGLPKDVTFQDVTKGIMKSLAFRLPRTAEIAAFGPLADKARAFRDRFLLTAKKLQVPTAVYPLADVAKAHADYEASRTTGKVVLKIA